jgi:ferritin
LILPDAGFKSAGVIVEIMNEDGSMARLPQLAEVAKDLKLVSIEDLVAYRMQHDSLIIKKITTLKHATVLSGLEHTSKRPTNRYILP